MASYKFDRSEKNATDDSQSHSVNASIAQMDQSDAKVVRNSSKNEGSLDNNLKPSDGKNFGKRLASYDDDLYPALMDSNRPRDEWNISHVRPDSQRATSPANAENLNNK